MTPLPRTGSSPLSDMLDWLDYASPFHGRSGAPYIPVDEFIEAGTYVVRADLPGIDPEKDVEVTIDGDLLTIRGQRREENRAPSPGPSASRQGASPRTSRRRTTRASSRFRSRWRRPPPSRSGSRSGVQTCPGASNEQRHDHGHLDSGDPYR